MYRAAKLTLTAITVVLSTSGNAFAAGTKPAVSPPLNDCDRLTTVPGDPQQASGSIAPGKIDPQLAIAACRKATKAYPASARYQARLGYALQAGRQYSQAALWFRKSADNGNAFAMYRLGSLYFAGSGLPQDYGHAFKWFQRAANLGHVKAMHTIAVMYSDGQGTAKNGGEAINWYRKAAAKGNASSMYNLGIRNFTGDGLARDVRKAAHWFRQAAEHGNISAMHNIAFMYRQGLGVAKNPGKSVSWFKKAAERGHVGAMHNLAAMLDDNKIAGNNPQKAAGYEFMALAAKKPLAIRIFFASAKNRTVEFRIALQKKLIAGGFLNAPADGKFGPATIRAIKKLARQQ